ncbi:MAG: hypothetical protein ACF8XB_16590 [Planctomycetota bacterium JB042]
MSAITRSSSSPFRPLAGAALLVACLAPASFGQTVRVTNDRGGTRSVAQMIPEFGVLKAFDFEFGNGGHKLKGIALRRAGARTEVDLSDNDGNDPYSVAATYHDAFRFAPTEAETVEGRGTGVVTRLLADRRGFVPVLQGFSLVFADGGDHEVTELGVSLQPIREETGRHRLRVVLREHQDRRPFDFLVQIVWVPLGNIDDAQVTIGDRGRGNSAPNRPSNARGAAVLKGFSFRYMHDDGSDDSHYVKRARVDLGAPDRNGAAASFHDGDGDDRRQVSVSYATLR